MNIGLYFGTFNPIHIGHLIIANHMVEYSNLDEVWVIVSPQNPFKKKSNIIDNYQRYKMVSIALEEYPLLKPMDIEFNLSQPSYTINTLESLQKKHPYYQFSLIIGEDNFIEFHKWKNYEQIIENHNIYVYPRVLKKNQKTFVYYDKINKIKAPFIEISSTEIRKAIKENKNIKPLLPYKVWDHIKKMKFYK